MAFDTDQATVYQVRPRHRHQEVQEVVPGNYQGVMGTDRGRSYEDKSFRRVKQQKCLANLQRTLSEVLAHQKGRAETWRNGPGNCCGWRCGCGKSTTGGFQSGV
jgi:hypothetical protein